MKSIYFNAHHSPIGAFASFTLGFKGAKGGFGLELGKPADQNVYIGLEANEGNYYEALPFYHGAEDESKRYDLGTSQEVNHKLRSFPLDLITRDYQLTSDTWNAGDLSFTIYSPVASVPNPDDCDEEEMRRIILPAVFVEIKVDNTKGTKNRKAFFGFQGNDPYSSMNRLEDVSNLIGIAQGRFYGIATNDRRVRTASGFSIDRILNEPFIENYTFGLGSTGLLMVEVPKGEKQTYSFSVSFYREGFVTAGLDCQYYYTKYFKNLIEVSQYACQHVQEYIKRYKDFQFCTENLSDDQQFLLNHAVRSYYGSTEFLLHENQPFWVVNEGEYRMMNTFDLTVDQLFYEMKMNPWTVKNELDWFIKRYSYEDQVRLPGDEKTYRGGISFAHDMGVANSFSRKGSSAYEMVGLTGCFSHMTHEQLVNFICCSGVYGMVDPKWIDEHLSILMKCFESMVNRDHIDEALRDGIMSLDSSRCMGGSEITTYDSLDISLGQARNNVYLAGKCFASYIILENIFRNKGFVDLANQAELQAKRCSNTLINSVTTDGIIPAVLENQNESKIIPAIEGLVYLYFINNDALKRDGKYGKFLSILRNHLQKVLVKGVCLFDDHGWKLSSTSDNSWLSKIFLNQFVCKKILGLDYDSASDRAHVNWLLHENESYWCFSDQIIAGVATGSKYYPRGVTSILWLEF